MIYEYREYQEECVGAMLQDVLSTEKVHPVVALPTGSGKSYILSKFIYDYQEEKPTDKILVLSHTENILKQDHEAICNFFPGINIGLYSAGLGSRDIQKVTVAGIQSIYRKPELFEDFDIAIIDECHTVPTKGNGMYRQFFKAVPLIRIGLSATIFRTGHGFIHVGEGALFNKISYDLCSMKGFNKLVEDGYLTKLFAKPTELQLDTKGVKTSAGDYNIKDMSKKFDRETITEEAVKEVVKFGKNYKSWLIFAIDIDHCEHITEELVGHGIEAVALHSKNNGDRHRLTDDFKAGRTRCIVSVGMITTGFDAPNIDLIVLLRPTKSPVLHVQMVGRGLRIAQGKTHCLVLDFCGNIKKLGPINDVTIPTEKKKKEGTGEGITKTCPNCKCLHHPTVKICDVCGHVFEFQQKISTSAKDSEIVRKPGTKKWLKVDNVFYSLHDKIGSPTSMKVRYICGMAKIDEYICYDHKGWAKHKANNWVDYRWNFEDMPTDVRSLFRNAQYLDKPTEIFVDYSSKFPEIKDMKF